MPLLQEWTDDHGATTAIWQITEPEEFFAQATGLTSDIKNDKRRIEFLAGRYLLRHIEEDIQLHHIYKDEHDKPQLLDNVLHFSLSHSFPFIAAIISPHQQCGIDIQTPHPRILTLAPKFISPLEAPFFNNNPELVTLAWTAKEAAYKWLGRRGVDFIRDLKIEQFYQQENQSIFIFNCITGQNEWKLNIKSFYNQSFCFSSATQIDN